MNRSGIQSIQLARLQKLRRALVPANFFYSQKLTAEFSSLAEFAARVPFTTKAEFVEDQRIHPPFGTNLTYRVAAYTRFCQTSSTTGHPLRWVDTEESWDWMLDCWTRVFQAAGVAKADRIFFAFSFGPFLGFWTAFDAATRLGCLAIPGGGMSSTARLRTLIDTCANVLCCTPTYAVRLAEVARQEEVDLSALAVKTIIVAGEPGGSVPGTRAMLERLWPGTRIVDHHGMTETGPVSYECPLRPGVLHVNETEFCPESVDPHSGDSVPDGKTGELVITNLGRIASPPPTLALPISSANQC